MYITYEELELFEFFESTPKVIGEYESGDRIYSYERDDFKIILLVSTYEMYIEVSVTYQENVVYSQRHSDVLEIRKVDSDTMRIIGGKEYSIIVKKKPQIVLLWKWMK